MHNSSVDFKNSVLYHTVSIDTLVVYVVALEATVSLLWGTIVFIVALRRNPNMSQYVAPKMEIRL
jgi:hypothetical protein